MAPELYFFSKQRSDIETINDLDGDVVNLFYWVKHDPEKLAHEVYYTPYARQIYDNAYLPDAKESSLNKAVKFLIRLNMGYGYRTTEAKVGWKNDVQGREKAYAALDWKSLPDRIIEVTERLRGVQIENRQAVDVISKFNYENVLIYLYWTRRPSRSYAKAGSSRPAGVKTAHSCGHTSS